MHRGKKISARKFPHALNTAHSIHYDIPLSETRTAILLADSSKLPRPDTMIIAV